VTIPQPNIRIRRPSARGTGAVPGAQLNALTQGYRKTATPSTMRPTSIVPAPMMNPPDPSRQRVTVISHLLTIAPARREGCTIRPMTRRRLAVQGRPLLSSLGCHGGAMEKSPMGYALRPGVPTTSDYLRLRRESGLTPRSVDQASRALSGSWAACHVVSGDDGETVGMGRLIGDGGWYFHLVDMAVLPAHQRRGIGDWILTWLLDQVRETAPPDAFVSLMADPPGRRLYARHGVTENRDLSTGMAMWLGREEVAPGPEDHALPASGCAGDARCRSAILGLEVPVWSPPPQSRGGADGQEWRMKSGSDLGG
jgi:GNAT superfamily N-acetyltransferase